jgi:hypothetical protein
MSKPADTNSKMELDADNSHRESKNGNADTPAFVIAADSIQAVWECEDPKTHVKDLLLTWIEAEEERTGEDLQKWDENEDRFHTNELNWMAQFMIHNLTHCKAIGLKDDAACACLLNVFWTTLDILGANGEIVASAGKRYTNMQLGLRTMYDEGSINKEQIAKTLQYARVTLFGHLQLFMACI